MTWKQITNFDSSVDVIMSIQNNSLIPYSKVTIQFTTAAAPEEGKGFVLTGPNQWTQRVPAGTNVFYKEEDGGIATWWSREIEKLVNYDIPTQEEEVPNLTSKSIICPEGSYITMQNKSKTPIYYNFLGKANFVLTEHQAVSYTFSKNNVVNFSSDGTGILEYMIGQSPNVTMLSEATQKLLDEMNAKIEGLIENSATKNELDIVKRRTYFGKWSPFINITGGAGNKIISPVFMKDNDFKSEFISDKAILDIALELTYNRTELSKPVDEKATIRLTVITQPAGKDHQLSSFYCDTPWIARAISGLEVYRDNTNGQLKFVLNLKSNINSYTLVASVRNDDTKFVKSTLASFLNEKIATYTIDKDNDNIHFTDENFYVNIMKSWDLSLTKSKYKVTELKKTDTTEGNNSIQTFSSTSEANFSIKYKQDMNGRSGILTVDVPKTVGANNILGLNIKTIDVSQSDNVYLDLIVMGNGSQNKTNSPNSDTFTIPLWNHIKFGYSYISDRLAKITTDNASKYYIEVIYN